MTPDSCTLSPETWPFSLEWLPPQACLVGGAVRDALLLRKAEYLDLDFVVPVEAVKIARRLANHYQAGFVVLDAQRQIARVVFDGATVDVAQQEGDTLETDLKRRDFTINAIAYNPHTNQLIDPLQGVADCRARIIRMVSPQNLSDDPLRLLRAYRQAAQLKFIIEPTTQSTLRQLAPLLKHVAAERVQAELGYLLESPHGTPWLTAAWQDQLLQPWLPDATAQRVQKLAAVDESARGLAESWPELGLELGTSVSGKSSSLLSLAKLATLLPSVPKAAQEQLSFLKYSRAEIRTISITLQYLPQLLSHEASPMSLKEQYFFFQTVGSVFPVLVVLAVAMGMAVDGITSLIQRYLNPDDQVAHPTPLVTGNDLMRTLNLPASPQVGTLLTELQLARIEGKINGREEALDLAAQLIDAH